MIISASKKVLNTPLPIYVYTKNRLWAEWFVQLPDIYKMCINILFISNTNLNKAKENTQVNKKCLTLKAVGALEEGDHWYVSLLIS